MRKRIGTKVYDTDKAVLVTVSDGVLLYKKNGSSVFFAVKFTDNGYYIEPVSWSDAKEMCKNISEQDYNKYFGGGDDLNKKVSLTNRTVRFSEYDIERIKRLANQQDMSMSKFILMLVDRYEAEQDRG